jgi:hypothetical protein
MTAEMVQFETTHVLSWLPPYLYEGPAGFWELRTADDFAAGEPPASQDWFLDAPREIGLEYLESWTAETLGYPVWLETSHQDLRKGRFWGRWHSEPVCFVHPGEVPS